MLEGREKNYGQKTGVTLDTGALRAKSGKKPYSPPKIGKKKEAA
jgi:hypothetical protein